MFLDAILVVLVSKGHDAGTDPCVNTGVAMDGDIFDRSVRPSAVWLHNSWSFRLKGDRICCGVGMMARGAFHRRRIATTHVGFVLACLRCPATFVHSWFVHIVFILFIASVAIVLT